MASPNYTFQLVVPFSCSAEAEVAYNSLRVDKEPLRGGVQKSFRLDEQRLIVDFEAVQAKHLRVSVGTFMELLALVIKTVDRFGPPVSP